MAEPRLEVPPCDMSAVLALERELGVSRAGPGARAPRPGEPAAARAFLAADDAHDPAASTGSNAAGA